ncbi:MULTISPECIES: YveK family protein [Clostridia]|jgi:capsular polysaccharide biosynthesis protein|uniref:YveK family protein n=1 Tax=Clostridia TaxID=186801 RepID=UPI000E510FCB|nr:MULTISPECIES: Wzz/FepE/Etk N-terminal domain-containing protein [Clostridia]RHV68823.1 polysaccharide export protein [Roseburia sp. OM02-15]
MNKDQLKEEKEMEIDLLSLFFYLIQKWKILLLGAIIGGILAEGMTLLKTPMYQSTSTLYMLSKTTSITSMADLQLGSELSSDFTIIASSKPVVDAAVESLKEDKNITLTRGQIQNMLSVANKEDTRMLSITVTSDDPELSYEVADAVTTAAVAQMAAITQTDPPTIVEHPEVASDAMDNGMRKNLAVGILAGLVLVAAIYVILYMMNDRIQTEEDIQTYLDATVLGVIPVDKELAYYSKQEEKNEKGRHGRKKKA